MTVALRLKNFDEIFERTKNEKFFLNLEDPFSNENREKIDNIIMTNYSEDTLSLVPSCTPSCGELQGTYYVGDVCNKCGTTVTSSVDDSLAFLVWVERPIGVQKFISPVMMSILLDRYKTSSPQIKLVEWIINPKYRMNRPLSVRARDSLDKLTFLMNKEGIKRGYNNFIENFYKIIEILEFNFVTRKTKKLQQEFYDWVLSERGNIFSEYLPFPNKSIFALDSNELGSFYDRDILDPLNSIRRLTGIDLHNNSIAKKEAKVAKSLIELANFGEKYMKKSFFEKPGLIRQHISSTRSHFSARGVVTSIQGPHLHDEIQLPWSLAVTFFREYLIKGLLSRGFSYKDAVKHFMFHNRIYSPVIDEIFNEMLLAAGGYIECIFIRNPSLHRGSVCAVKISRIKTEVEDKTISMALPLCPNYNADFDGDEMNIQGILTERARRQLVNLRPHHSVLSLSGPNKFSGSIKYSKTITSTLSNWFEADK